MSKYEKKEKKTINGTKIPKKGQKLDRHPLQY